MKSLWHRVKLAVHVLRGRALVYGVHLVPPRSGDWLALGPQSSNVVFSNCHLGGNEQNGIMVMPAAEDRPA